MIFLFIFIEIMVREPTVCVHSNYYSVGEGDGSLEVCAELTTDQFDGNFQANFVTIGDRAEGLLLIS